jgi:flagellar motor switch protein FliM
MVEQDNLLSAEELQALSAGLEDGSLEVGSGLNTSLRVVKHDLASEDTSLGINVSSIDMINERFIRQLRVGLVEVLRTTPKVQVAEIKTMRFHEYVSPLKSPLSVNTIRINPLRGFSLVVIDTSVIFACLDNFFGGFGRGIGELPPGRLFTPTETSIIQILVDLIFGALKDAWAPILNIDCERISAEVTPQFVQIAEEGDLVVMSRFKMELDDVTTGHVDIVYPYSALKPIRDLLRIRVQTGDDSDEGDQAWRSSLTSAAGDAKLAVEVQLAEIISTVGKIREFKEGDLIYFHKPDFATIKIAGSPVFAAEVGANGPQTAVRINHSIAPSTK